MTDLTTSQNQFQHYDTSINIIGGLRDMGVIFKAVAAHFDDEDSLHDLIIGRNGFDLRTEKSKKRVLSAVEIAFLDFLNDDHEAMFRTIFSSSYQVANKEIILFWQYALLNRLFREISTNVFAKYYLSGKTQISKDDIIGYLKELLAENNELASRWSETTVQTISTKYLNIMNKLGFVEGSRVRTYRHITIADETLVLFLYFSRLYDTKKNILKNGFLPLAFVNSDDLLARLKKLSLKNYFDMNFNGIDLNIELRHSYSGICDVLYN